MADTPAIPPRGPEPAPVGLMTCLAATAALAAALGPLLGLLRLLIAASDNVLDMGVGVQAALLILGGPAIGCLLWAASWMVRCQHAAWAVQRRLLGQEPRPSPAPPAEAPPTAPAEAEMWRKAMEQLSEINASLLLSPEQRQQKHQQQRLGAAKRTAEEIDRAIQQGRYDRAQELLRGLKEEFPDFPDLESLEERQTRTRFSAEEEDFRNQAQRVGDLMGVGSFREAKKLSEDLLAKYPRQGSVMALAERVRREAASFEAEHLRGLCNQIDRHVNLRQWRQAVEAARSLLDLYPNTSEADLVVSKMYTLEENARIEEAREMRDRIRQLIEERNFADAYELAQKVVTSYPRTAIAEELRQQMPRLEELASPLGELGRACKDLI